MSRLNMEGAGGAPKTSALYTLKSLEGSRIGILHVREGKKVEPLKIEVKGKGPFGLGKHFGYETKNVTIDAIKTVIDIYASHADSFKSQTSTADRAESDRKRIEARKPLDEVIALASKEVKDEKDKVQNNLDAEKLLSSMVESTRGDIKKQDEITVAFVEGLAALGSKEKAIQVIKNLEMVAADGAEPNALIGNIKAEIQRSNALDTEHDLQLPDYNIAKMIQGGPNEGDVPMPESQQDGFIASHVRALRLVHSIKPELDFSESERSNLANKATIGFHALVAFSDTELGKNEHYPGKIKAEFGNPEWTADELQIKDAMNVALVTSGKNKHQLDGALAIWDLQFTARRRGEIGDTLTAREDIWQNGGEFIGRLLIVANNLTDPQKKQVLESVDKISKESFMSTDETIKVPEDMFWTTIERREDLTTPDAKIAELVRLTKEVIQPPMDGLEEIQQKRAADLLAYTLDRTLVEYTKKGTVDNVKAAGFLKDLFASLEGEQNEKFRDQFVKRMKEGEIRMDAVRYKPGDQVTGLMGKWDDILLPLTAEMTADSPERKVIEEMFKLVPKRIKRETAKSLAKRLKNGATETPEEKLQRGQIRDDLIKTFKAREDRVALFSSLNADINIAPENITPEVRMQLEELGKVAIPEHINDQFLENAITESPLSASIMLRAYTDEYKKTTDSAKVMEKVVKILARDDEKSQKTLEMFLGGLLEDQKQKGKGSAILADVVQMLLNEPGLTDNTRAMVFVTSQTGDKPLSEEKYLELFNSLNEGKQREVIGALANHINEKLPSISAPQNDKEGPQRIAARKAMFDKVLLPIVRQLDGKRASATSKYKEEKERLIPSTADAKAIARLELNYTEAMLDWTDCKEKLEAAFLYSFVEEKTKQGNDNFTAVDSISSPTKLRTAQEIIDETAALKAEKALWAERRDFLIEKENASFAVLKQQIENGGALNATRVHAGHKAGDAELFHSHGVARDGKIHAGILDNIDKQNEVTKKGYELQIAQLDEAATAEGIKRKKQLEVLTAQKDAAEAQVATLTSRVEQTTNSLSVLEERLSLINDQLTTQSSAKGSVALQERKQQLSQKEGLSEQINAMRQVLIKHEQEQKEADQRAVTQMRMAVAVENEVKEMSADQKVFSELSTCVNDMKKGDEVARQADLKFLEIVNSPEKLEAILKVTDSMNAPELDIERVDLYKFILGHKEITFERKTEILFAAAKQERTEQRKALVELFDALPDEEKGKAKIGVLILAFNLGDTTKLADTQRQNILEAVIADQKSGDGMKMNALIVATAMGKNRLMNFEAIVQEVKIAIKEFKKVEAVLTKNQFATQHIGQPERTSLQVAWGNDLAT